MNIILLSLLGGLAALLAQAGLAVFHDGLRPLLADPVDRRALLQTGLGLSLALIVGLGLPLTLVSGVVQIHLLLLMTDLIGVASPGRLVAFAGGAAWGALLALLTQLPPLGAALFLPVVVAYFALPSIAAFLFYGWRGGGLTLLASWAAYQIGRLALGVNPGWLAFGAGLLVLLGLAAGRRPEGPPPGLATLFAAKGAEVRQKAPLFLLLGGLLASVAHLGLVAADPISLGLVVAQQPVAAGLVALVRGLSFLPLVVTTALTTGTFATAGSTLAIAAGLFSPNLWVAAAAGLTVTAFEVYGLSAISNLLEQRPGLREAAEHLRTAMGKLAEPLLLAGSLIAVAGLAPGLGLFVFVGLLALNEATGLKVNRLAAGPAALLGVKLLAWVGLL